MWVNVYLYGVNGLLLNRGAFWYKYISLIFKLASWCLSLQTVVRFFAKSLTPTPAVYTCTVHESLFQSAFWIRLDDYYYVTFYKTNCIFVCITHTNMHSSICILSPHAKTCATCDWHQCPFCENNLQKNCVLIWNGEKCDCKWFSVIQNGRQQPLFEEKK